MKCAACGYEKRNEMYETNKVTYFKSGPRKGQIKSVEVDHIFPDEKMDNFIEIRPLGTDQYFIRMDSDSWQSPVVEMYACPSCGTVKIEA